jgi:hypothetical protein
MLRTHFPSAAWQAPSPTRQRGTNATNISTNATRRSFKRSHGRRQHVDSTPSAAASKPVGRNATEPCAVPGIVRCIFASSAVAFQLRSSVLSSVAVYGTHIPSTQIPTSYDAPSPSLPNSSYMANTHATPRDVCHSHFTKRFLWVDTRRRGHAACSSATNHQPRPALLGPLLRMPSPLGR